jgi:hypothetical protein
VENNKREPGAENIVHYMATSDSSKYDSKSKWKSRVSRENSQPSVEG